MIDRTYENRPCMHFSRVSAAGPFKGNNRMTKKVLNVTPGVTAPGVGGFPCSLRLNTCA